MLHAILSNQHKRYRQHCRILVCVCHARALVRVCVALSIKDCYVPSEEMKPSITIFAKYKNIYLYLCYALCSTSVKVL